jgi:hypothetical protein
VSRYVKKPWRTRVYEVFKYPCKGSNIECKSLVFSQVTLRFARGA